MKVNTNFTHFWFFISLTAILIPSLTFAQKQNKIKKLGAKSAIMDTKKGTRILVGDVRFKQGKTLMFCDSAVSYAKANEMKAFGNVKIEDKSNHTTMVGDSLIYSSTTGIGKLRGSIVLKSKTQILKTSILDFDTKSNLSKYYGGGTITNTENNSVLKSERGYYYSNSQVFFFKKNVVYINEEYTILSDTLEYVSLAEKVKFHGPTNITSDSNSIYCESGFYDKPNHLSTFSVNVKMISTEQTMNADSVIYNQQYKIGKAYGNVEILDTINKSEIYGDYAKYNNIARTSLVTGNLRLVMEFTNDTLQLHSDSLFTNMDSTNQHRLVHAYHHVQFYKPDMQGKCDSLSLSELDSTIRMYNTPVVWVDSNQVTGKEIIIKNYDGIIDNMQIFEEAFITSEEDSALYNQVKGKALYAHFKNNEIYKIDVNRSGQTIYYARDEANKLMGMNRLNCSNMSVFIDSTGVNNIKFYKQPDGTFLPMDKVTTEMKLLRHFYWRANEQPKTVEDIFNWTDVPDYITNRRVSRY